MVNSQTTSITPAQHAGRHVIGGADPLVDPLLLHASRHEIGGADAISSGYITSGTDIMIADNPVENYGSDTATYKKIKEIVLHSTPASIKLTFGLRSNVAGKTAYGRIYRNGAAVGTERTVVGTVPTAFEEIISGWSNGDLLQLYVHGDGSTHRANCLEFRILGSSNVSQVVAEVV